MKRKAAAEIAEATATKQRSLKAPLPKSNRCRMPLSWIWQPTKSRYDAWRKYRVLLTRVDTSLARILNWPEPPKD
jgi:hypothetical protein